MNKFKEREEQINVQLERMGAPFRVETWSKWRNGVQNYPMRRKTPCFSYGDIRRVHRIYASN